MSNPDMVEFSYNEKNYRLYSNGDLYGEFLGNNWKKAKWVLIKGSTNYKSGYVSVQLGHWSKGKKKIEYLHRLVAKYFIPNPDNKPCVNHKDGNKKNNQVCNLEWVTYSENHKHAYAILKRKTNVGKSLGGGVYFKKDKKKWIAIGHFDSTSKFLGYFNNEEEARLCVDEFNKSVGKTRL